MAYFESRLTPFIKAFIISDALMYASLNLVNILFAVYVTTNVPGGTVQSATTAIAVGLVARIIVELNIGRRTSRLTEQRKLQLVIVGLAAMSLSYVGFAMTHNIILLAAFWILNGVGWAVAYPAKLALVARHINHKQSTQEWGLTDALNMTLVVITMVIGSQIVSRFNYELLFLLAAAISAFGIIPYARYGRTVGKKEIDKQSTTLT